MRKPLNGTRGLLKEITTTYQGLAAVAGIALAAILAWSWVGPAIKGPLDTQLLRSEFNGFRNEQQATHQVIAGEHIRFNTEIGKLDEKVMDVRGIVEVLLCLEIEDPLTLYGFDVTINCTKVRGLRK